MLLQGNRDPGAFHGFTALIWMKRLGFSGSAAGTVTVISSTGEALLETTDTGVKPGQVPLSVVDDW